MNATVDEYLKNVKKWQSELYLLREILLECGLTEELKWSKPCYLYLKSNIVILYTLKDCCAIGFLKGAILNDSEKILIKPGENSQSGRWIKFTSKTEIEKLKPTIKAYIFEAIEIEKAGIKVDFSANIKLVFPIELENKLKNNKEFKTAFEALTPGRQRAYNLFFTAPKQSKTRESRIESYTNRILMGKGFNDCICGLSKKMPSCDGSHKFLNK